MGEPGGEAVGSRAGVAGDEYDRPAAPVRVLADQAGELGGGDRVAVDGERVPGAVREDLVRGGVVGEEVAPWLDLVRKLGLLVGALSTGLPTSLSVQVRGELASEDVGVLRLSALRGLFSTVIEDPVTFVNAPALAAERGVEASIDTESESPNHRSVVDVRAVAADATTVNVAGALSGPQQVEKIVQINGRNLDLRAEGVNLSINYDDQPGALAQIGEVLGRAGVNIEGLCAVTSGGGHAEVHVLVQDLEAALPALARSGLAVSSEQEVVVVALENRPGALGAVSRRLGEAGVNITLTYLATNTRLVLAADNLAAARAALGK